MIARPIPRRFRRTPRSVIVSRLVSLAGCAVAMQPSAASAEAARPVPPAGPAAHDARPPWSGNGGFPPPRPLVRTRAATPSPHPAVHPVAGVVARPSAPLFPRASDALERSRARKAAMERHPAGKGLVGTPPRGHRAAPPGSATPTERAVDPEESCGPRHLVRPGETLWGIASRRSVSDRPVDILRLTTEIYRMNKNVIGPDPDLILPGQLLELPESCAR